MDRQRLSLSTNIVSDQVRAGNSNKPSVSKETDEETASDDERMVIDEDKGEGQLHK